MRERTRVLTELKLAAGKTWSAWRGYPATRRALLAARPGPPILVTGMYRTGTTWVGAMLAPAGLWHLHEPFNPNRRMWREELVFAEPDTPRRDVDAFVRRLLQGGHRAALRLPRAGHRFAPLRLLPFAPRRVLVKDPSAALLSEYLVRRHGMRAVVLFRHPAAVVSSLLRLGWPTGELVARLLSDEALMEGPLARARVSMTEAANRRDAISGVVLYGCVATMLWTFTERNPESMIRLQFEDLCADPIGAFRALFQWLDLDCDERVARVHERLTGGAGPGVDDPHGVVRSSADMRWVWRERTAAADLSAVRELWERFDVPLYRDPSHWTRGVEVAG